MPVQRWLVIAVWMLVVAVAVPVSATTSSVGPFRFSMPEGFIELSETTSPELLTALPTEVVAEADRYQSYAVMLTDSEIVGAFMVKMTPGKESVKKALETLVRQLRTGSQNLPDERISSRIVRIADTDCGRVETRLERNGKNWREVVVLVPSGELKGWFKLTARDDYYDVAHTAFHQALSDTQGIEAPPGLRTPAKVAIGAGILALGVYVFVSRRRKRKDPPAKPRSRKKRAQGDRDRGSGSPTNGM